MAESADKEIDDGTPTLKAAKDKNCPYCNLPFTSSSLGRHLDLFIKDTRPKPPDGIHNVEAIRKLREGITRRQPKGVSGRRDSSTPAGTPTASSRKSPASDHDSSTLRSPALQREHQNPADLTANLAAFQPRWESTGVINDIPLKGGDGVWRRERDTPAPARPVAARTISRQMTKAQFDVKQKVQAALDTARAAELALREIMGSWRAAKQHIGMNSMPFDFDPLSLDFPALTLQCLQPPPTLFSSTQHSTPTSWSIAPPGIRQHEALQLYFQEEFRKWKVTCAAATTAVQEELVYPPPASVEHRNVKEAVRRAEEVADSLEQQVDDHLQSAYSVWDNLPTQRRSELWQLELARSVGRKQKEVEKSRETQHSLKQEVASLKSQIEHLNRLQQPREFKLFSPTTIPISEDMLMYMQEQAVVKGRRGVGLNLDDRHSDLDTVVSTAIDRWKSVIVTSRSASGMNAQRRLDQTPVTPGRAALPNPPVATPVPVPAAQQSQQQRAPAMQQPIAPQNYSVMSPTGPAAPTPVAATPVAASPMDEEQEEEQSDDSSSAASIEDDDMSDQDADAEMEDDDGFAQMNTPISQPQPPLVPQQQAHQLEVPRTRAPLQRMATGGSGPKANFGMAANRAMSHTGHQGGGQVNMNQSMPDINATMYGHHAHHTVHPDAMSMQGIKGDPMYME